MKLISIVRGKEGQDRARLQRWMLRSFGPELVSAGWRCAVSPLEANPAADVLLEVWQSAPAALAAIHSARLLRRAHVTTYQVEELVGKDEPIASGAPVVKQIAAFLPREDVSRADTRRHWDEHVPLANRIHVGCVRYVRNWTVALAMSSAAWPLPYQGFAIQYFRTRQDLEERLFDRPESVKIIQDDVSDFISAVDVMVGTEYVFESAAGIPLRSAPPLAGRRDTCE